MLKQIWLSYPLNKDTPTYGNSNGFRVELDKRLAAGDSCNTSNWQLPSHIGTHVDAPRHFDHSGFSVDYFEPAFWVFDAVSIVEVQISASAMIISKEMVVPYITGEPELLLIITGMGKFRQEKVYWEANPGLSPELGQVLKESFPSIRAVGIDAISISSWQNRELGREAHRAFLGSSEKEKALVLIEDMDLSQISSSAEISRVIVMPLRVSGADGSPCTVVAEVEE